MGFSMDDEVIFIWFFGKAIATIAAIAVEHSFNMEGKPDPIGFIKVIGTRLSSIRAIQSSLNFDHLRIAVGCLRHLSCLIAFVFVRS